MSAIRPHAQGHGTRAVGRALRRVDGQHGRRGHRLARSPATRARAHCPTAPRSRPRPSRPPPASRAGGGGPQRAPGTGRPGRRRPPPTSGIPSAALAAYQRAEAVINAADTSCELPWQLIAAIGRVESDHGRFGGNVLDDDGVAQPGIYGIALDGRNNTQRITDTDAGQYDSDAKYDRAVGPMQFIPSTWSVVGVDGDNDGKRNPQDIDDAALATAVYLCSGDDDLSAEQGQRASVYRYNHSNDYVDLVLSIMQAYMDGEFTVGADPHHLRRRTSSPPRPGRRGRPRTRAAAARTASRATRSPRAAPPTPTKTAHRAAHQDRRRPTQQPTQQPTQSPTKTPTTKSDRCPVPVPPTLPTLPSTSVPPLDQTLTYVQAVAQCTTQGVIDNPLTATNELANCANALLAP